MNYVTGNLIDLAEQGHFDIIVQGCNCFNTMNSGLAKEIKSRYPEVAVCDQKTSAGDYNKLGNFTASGTIFNRDHNFIVVNAYTQFDYGRDGKDRFEYTAFDLILQKLAFRWGHSKLGFPMIGCGLAGGDEKRIMASLHDFAETIAPSGGTVTIVRMP